MTPYDHQHCVARIVETLYPGGGCRPRVSPDTLEDIAEILAQHGLGPHASKGATLRVRLGGPEADALQRVGMAVDVRHRAHRFTHQVQAGLDYLLELLTQGIQRPGSWERDWLEEGIPELFFPPGPTPIEGAHG